MMKRVVVTLIVLMVASIGCAGEPAPADAKEPVAVGAKAPAFSLVNTVDGKTVSFKPGDGKVSVVVFTCNQCPYAKAFEGRIIELAKQYAGKGVVFYAVNPNDEARFAEETVANMKARAVDKGYPFPYLKDGDSSVARAFGARVTPHVFVVDKGGDIRYRGYVDDTAKAEERSNTGLSNALDQLLAGQTVAQTVTREFGCAIKWKA
jgi:thiol-disulfide isomerase/thioredoxin